MPESDLSGEVAVPRDAVQRSAGGSYWSVAGCAWDGLDAALAEELATLLAPPIVVGAATRSGAGEPVSSADPNALPMDEPVEPAEPATRPEPAERATAVPSAPAHPGPERPAGRHRRPTLELFLYRAEPPSRREPPVLVPAPPRAAPGRHRRRG